MVGWFKGWRRARDRGAAQGQGAAAQRAAQGRLGSWLANAPLFTTLFHSIPHREAGAHSSRPHPRHPPTAPPITPFCIVFVNARFYTNPRPSTHPLHALRARPGGRRGCGDGRVPPAAGPPVTAPPSAPPQSHPPHSYRQSLWTHPSHTHSTHPAPAQVDDVVVAMDESLRPQASGVAMRLRKAGRAVELVLESKKMKWSLKVKRGFQCKEGVQGKDGGAIWAMKVGRGHAAAQGRPGGGAGAGVEEDEVVFEGKEGVSM